MIKLLIIADDFTGALDTGVQFSKRNIPTLITTNYKLCLTEEQKNFEVLVVDIETRHMEPKKAYQRCYNLVKLAQSLGIQYFYKKTDSTLRGNIGSELAAVMDALNEDVLYFIPAFPKQNRACINGNLYVNGSLLHETVYAKDPFTPIVSSSIKDIIALQTDIPVKITNANDCSFKNHDNSGKQIVVIDAETEQDLKRIGEMFEKKNVLLSGSAGLAEVLPDIIEFKKSASHKMPVINGDTKTLLICGSINEVSLQQIKVAEQAGIDSIVLSSEALLNPDYSQSAFSNRLITRVGEIISSKRVAILKTVTEKESVSGMKIGFINSLDIQEKKQHIEIAKNIGKLVEKLIKQNDIDNLIVFGGDTLFGILDSQKCKYVYPDIEVFPGVIQSHVELSGREICLFTKAGGFGCETMLLELMQRYNLF